MSAIVVVVEVVDVVVDVVDVVEEVVEVDVLGGVVVDVVGALVAADSAATTSPDESSPQAARTSRAAQPTAIHCRRMTHSASGNQRCNVTVAACWPERMHAGIPIP